MEKREIGQNIKKYREKNDMSQTDLAKIMNTTRQCISSWEKNRTQPDIETIEKLTILLNCTLADLLGLGEQSPDNMARRLRVARAAGIPLYEMDVNPKERDRIISERMNSVNSPIVKRQYNIRANASSIPHNYEKGNIDRMRKAVIEADDASNAAANVYSTIEEIEFEIQGMTESQLKNVLNYIKFTKSRGGD